MELLRFDSYGLRPGVAWVCAWILAMSLAVAPALSAAEEMTGTVVRVLSGDTLVVSDGKDELEIRLADIGAPQGSEYYTPASRMLLSNMVSGNTVRVVITGRDGANRAFGRVFVGPLNVNLALVQRAAAWLCIEYATQTDYLPYENDAIRFRRGVWLYTTQFDARNRCRAHPPALKPVGED